jgi:hypothetical protein
VSDTNTLGLILSFAGVCVVNGGAVAVVWIQGKTRSDRTDAKIDEVGIGVNTAADKADTVARRVEPISNGFASEVRVGLAEIRVEQARGREALQEVRQTVEKAISRLDEHIGDHAKADVLRGRSGD